VPFAEIIADAGFFAWWPGVPPTMGLRPWGSHGCPMVSTPLLVELQATRLDKTEKTFYDELSHNARENRSIFF